MNISVVVPLYNKAPHVARALRSALDQSEPPREIIVVDDGSTDGSLDEVSSVPQDTIKLLQRGKPGPGGYAARNFGIRHASGEWIAFLDADDRWRPDHLRYLREALVSSGSDAGCAFSAYTKVHAAHETPRLFAEETLPPLRPLALSDLLRGWLANKRCPMWTGAILARRDDLLKAGLFPEGRARRGGDKDLWLRLAAVTSSVYSPRITSEFHQETVNRVSNITPHWEPPIICSTIADLAPAVDASTRKLLERVSNLELALYARHSAGAGAFNPVMAKMLYYPSGLKQLALMGPLFAAAGLRRIRTGRAVTGQGRSSS